MSMLERQEYIKKRLQTRYRASIDAPEWTPDEMKEMSYKMRIMISAGQRLKWNIRRRLAHAIPEGVLDDVERYSRERFRPADTEAQDQDDAPLRRAHCPASAR
jgi:hypothetical protein